MKGREIPLEEYRRISEGDRFRAAFDLYRCVVFFGTIQIMQEEPGEIGKGVVENTTRALLRVGSLFGHEKKRVYDERIEHILDTISHKGKNNQEIFRELQRLCHRVIRMLGIPDDELKQEYEYYKTTQAQAEKDSLKVVFDFLYVKKMLENSKFDSSQKARIHKLVEKYGEEKMGKRKLYRNYVEFRDTQKLRISSSTAILGALEELLILSDLSTDITAPYIEEVREYKKNIAETVSSSQNQEEVDIETFDVDAYLKKRFTKEYEDGYVRTNMDPKVIKKIDELAIRILTTFFPKLASMDDARRQQTLKKYIEVGGLLPHTNISAPNIYDEE